MAQSVTVKTAEVAATGGDDLDDNLDLDPDLLASSDAEGSGSGSADEHEEGEGDFDDDFAGGAAGLGSGDEDEDEGNRVKTVGVKRKVEDMDEEERKAEKKRRKKEKEKARKAKKQEKDLVASQSGGPPTHLSTSELSGVLLRSIRETLPSASSIELEEIVLPEDRLLPPPDYLPPAPSSDPFEPLTRRVLSLLQPLKNKKLKPATPRLIILALSGLRCADLVRGVRDFKGQGEVAKLFAKHFKVSEQAKYLEKTRVSIAVGTPGRVGQLLERGALKVNSDTVVLLEISHRDSKTRTLLSLPEVRDELWKTVLSGKSREALLSGGARIGAF